MIVMSDKTALSTIRRAVKTGSSTRRNCRASGDVRPPPPSARPRPTNTSNGKAKVPIRPSGSRTKILISSQVSLRRPLSTLILVAIRCPLSARGKRPVLPSPLAHRPLAIAQVSIPHRVSRQRQKHVLEIRRQGLKVHDPDPVLRDALDDVADEVLSSSSHDDPRIL